MNLLNQPVENTAVGIADIDSSDSFKLLRNSGIAAAIWRRQLPGDFQSWIDQLPVEDLPSARITVMVKVVRDAVEAILGSVGMPYHMNRRFLVDNVVSLVENFAALMNVQSVKLRFDVIQGDACRKFHIDAVTARLVCTYRGPGTQYGLSIDGEQPKQVFTTPTGAALLLRGTKWQESAYSNLLHRSPPIAGKGDTRLLLVIDPVIEEATEV